MDILPQWQAILKARDAQQQGADPAAAYIGASGGNAYGAGVPGRIKGVTALQSMSIMQNNRMGGIGKAQMTPQQQAEYERRLKLKGEIDLQNAANQYAQRTAGIPMQQMPKSPGPVPMQQMPATPAQPAPVQAPAFANPMFGPMAQAAVAAGNFATTPAAMPGKKPATVVDESGQNTAMQQWIAASKQRQMNPANIGPQGNDAKQIASATEHVADIRAANAPMQAMQDWRKKLKQAA